MPRADAGFMAEALRLGLSRKGRTSPNPAVGAVIVKGGRIISRGVHVAAGKPHAEVAALTEAGPRARGGVMYVTLEPCVTEGRTPACALAVAASALKRVVVGTFDPNAAVAGRGVAFLRDAGIDVTVGVLRRRCRHLAEDFATWITLGRPWVTAKFAMTLDGKIATHAGDSKWVTGEVARRESHVLRWQHAAVMVGRKTVLRDDPRLTARLEGLDEREGPTRVVVSARALVPEDALLWASAPSPPVWVACTTSAPKANACQIKRNGGEVIVCREKNGRVDVNDLLAKLAERGVSSVLVEGGGELLGDMADARVVDRVAAFVAPCVVGGARATSPVEGKGVETMAEAWRLRETRGRRLGADWYIDGYVTDVESLFELALKRAGV